MSFTAPLSPHRLFDLQDSFDKPMHFIPQLWILSPSKTGFIVSAHRLVNITLLTLVQTKLWFQGKPPTYILNEDTQAIIRAIGVSHTQLAKMSFGKIFDFTAGVYFYFLYYSKYYSTVALGCQIINRLPPFPPFLPLLEC